VVQGLKGKLRVLVAMDMDKGDLDWEEAENTLAGMEQVSLFAGAGNSLLQIVELGDDAKVVAAKGNLARREGEGLADRRDDKEHCMHTLELRLIGIGGTRATSSVEGAIAGIVARRSAVLQEPGGSAQI